MKKIKFKNIDSKKAIIGDTLAGFALMAGIAILLLVYLGIVFYMSEKKAIFSTGDVEISGGYYGEEFSELESLYSFLNMPVNYKATDSKISEILFKEPLSKEDTELYNVIDKIMKKYCDEYFIWVPEVGFSESGAQLNPYTKGLSYDFVNPYSDTPWNNGITYRPDINKEEVFVKFITLKKCIGGYSNYG
jgi:hypothetical protein